jgi:hypothetical protein
MDYGFWALEQRSTIVLLAIFELMYNSSMNAHSKTRENERRIRQQQQRVKHRKGKAVARSRPPTP